MMDIPPTGARIEFKWFHFKFTGTFVDEYQPWGNAWYVKDLQGYLCKPGTHYIARNQIKSWSLISIPLI